MLEEELGVGDERCEVGGGGDDRVEGPLEGGTPQHSQPRVDELPIHYIRSSLVSWGIIFFGNINGFQQADRFVSR